MTIEEYSVHLQHNESKVKLHNILHLDVLELNSYSLER